MKSKSPAKISAKSPAKSSAKPKSQKPAPESSALDSAKPKSKSPDSSAQPATPALLAPHSTPALDILTCLANLSSDEVFTPPKLVNAMLDLLPQELFSNPSATFLDPACKSGVFLREIAKRLMIGLEKAIPDSRKRGAHILSRQLFGITTTEMTHLLSMRTLYGAKSPAHSRYSILRLLGAPMSSETGNLYYDKHTPHDFKRGRCSACGASQDRYARETGLESYAYAFIHDLREVEKFFAKVRATPESTTESSPESTKGESMSFDVIVGNPPYQMDDGGAGASAKPIYHKFIERAKELNPKHIVMIIPARWYSGGKGLDDFRDAMLHDPRLVELHDFPNASDCFPDNEIKGGVCYFRWDSAKAESQRLLSDRGGAARYGCAQAA